MPGHSLRTGRARRRETTGKLGVRYEAGESLAVSSEEERKGRGVRLRSRILGTREGNLSGRDEASRDEVADLRQRRSVGRSAIYIVKLAREMSTYVRETRETSDRVAAAATRFEAFEAVSEW